jgi:Uma2 family endonuclease
MSQPAVSALAPLPFELVTGDGEPLETYQHVVQMTLLRDLARRIMAERGRTDFFMAGDIFVYHSYEQAREVAAIVSGKRPGKRYFRGPDFFFVGGVDPSRQREAWVAWEEKGRLPDLIVELLSPSTRKIDRTVKKDLYARTFRTHEYFLYEPGRRGFEGFRLAGDFYQPIAPDEHGRLWSEELGVAFGLWEGRLDDSIGYWLRLFYRDGRMVPTSAESAEAERQRAETAQARAESAEAELARLRALLAERDGQA